jgi:hypothetical protein
MADPFRQGLGLSQIERDSRARSAEAGSPSASRAIASSKKAPTSQVRRMRGAEPSRTAGSRRQSWMPAWAAR